MAESQGTPQQPTQKPWGIIGFAIATVGMGVLYRAVRGMDLGHTSLMFIGIPAILAILLSFVPPARSATGAIMKGMTLALLLTAPILGEGFICIIMAAPLFYFVGAAVGGIVDWRRKMRGIRLGCCALVLLPMSLEGVVPQFTFNRFQSESVTRVVDATPAEVVAALGHGPRLDRPLPLVLRIGFPRPIEAHGDGLAEGSLRVVRFTGAEGVPAGDVTTRVAEFRPGYLRTETVSDHTKLASWLRWQSSEVTWKPIDATHTSVTWRMEFQRQLDPAWYFIPWEKLAVHEAAAYMIENNATPQGR